jgi:hypothetical protein
MDFGSSVARRVVLLARTQESNVLKDRRGKVYTYAAEGLCPEVSYAKTRNCLDRGKDEECARV